MRSEKPFALLCVLLATIDIVAPMHSTGSGQSSAEQRAPSEGGSSSRAPGLVIGEKLMNFAGGAERHPAFAAELPHFQARLEDLQPYELAGYLTSLKPTSRKKLEKLLYVFEIALVKAKLELRGHTGGAVSLPEPRKFQLMS